MGLLGWAWTGTVYTILFLCLGVAVQQFLGNYGRERGYFEEQYQNRAKIGGPNYPLVVLYHGQPPGAQYEWNSGVWPAWGKDRHDLYHRHVHQPLDWQAAGTQVTKTCDVHCIITHDQSFLSRADAVVMELVNHYKFYGMNTEIPLAWPDKKSQQRWGLFYYEAPSEFPMISQNAEVLSKFDFLVTPQKEAAVPVTLMCDWGYPRAQFVTLPPPHEEAREKFLADFRGVTPSGYEDFFQELYSLLKIDIFAGPNQNTPLPDDPYTLPKRILQMGQYRFVFILESILEDNWICPELSQALLSGAVPIYLGAPNVNEFLPHAQAIVNVRDYSSPEELAEYLISFEDPDSWYDEFHSWKEEGLPPTFERVLDQCVHYAECRVCKQVLKLNHPESS